MFLKKYNQAGDGMSVTITLTNIQTTWTSSDGTEVTAKKLGDDSWEFILNQIWWNY